MKKILSLLLVCCLMFMACAFAEGQPEGLQKNVVILFTSDAHCGVEDNFGYAGLAAIRDYFAQNNYTLLVDNGDAIQGAPVGTLTTGSAIIEIMNAIGYDSMTMGNHEFDYGMDRFMELAEMSACGYISCNFTYNGETVFDPYTIKEFDGVKIAFVGVTTPRTFVSSTPTYFMNEDGEYVYGFCEGNDGQDLYDAIQSAVDAARGEGAQYVILQGHLGTEADCQPWTSGDVITHTTGIDAVLDGHSHSVIDPRNMVEADGSVELEEGTVKNAAGEDVILMACGTKLAHIGTLTISTDGTLSGRLYDWDFADNAATVWGLSGAAVEAVENATVELNEKMSEVVAHTDYDLRINMPGDDDVRIIRNMETNLGDLVADAYRAQAGNVDIALVNGGGIRKNIDAGDITLGQILSVHPFGNYLTVVEANGQQILDALEWTYRNVPAELGGFLHVSGLTCEINATVESACVADDHGSFAGYSSDVRRVQNVLVNGEPIDPEKTYTVASHDYMLKSGGDGTNMFMGDVILQDAVKLDNQVLIDYIIENLGGTVGEEYADPFGQGRIVIINE